MLILITRPLHQAQNLCSQLNQLGVETIIFPTIDIVLLDNSALKHTFTQHQPVQKIIFTSANAVDPVIPHLADNFSKECKIFAIGSATATALQHHHLSAIIPQNERFNSEGLLALPDLKKVDAENIIIFSGEGGRNVLVEVLSTRGAQVIKLPVYKRVLPTVNMTEVLANWQKKIIDYIISSSAESLNNLYSLVGEKNRDWLCEQRLIVISPSMALLAEQLGFKQKPLIAANASDQAILEVYLSLRLRA